MNNMEANLENYLDDLIELQLKKLGMSPKLHGYKYTRYIMRRGIEDAEFLNHLWARTYVETADHFETTPEHVERSIRYLCSKISKSSNLKVFNSIFGETNSFYENHRLTNSEFLCELLVTLKSQVRNDRHSDILDRNTLPVVKTCEVLYFYKDMPRLVQSCDGEWVDLYCAVDTKCRKGCVERLGLGVNVEIPCNYEAILRIPHTVAKKYGISSISGVDVISRELSSTHDMWMILVSCSKDCWIPKNTLVCQFRILKKQPKLIFKELL